MVVPKSNKLLQFTLDDGTGTDQTILSGIHKYYEPEELIGVPFIRAVMDAEKEGIRISTQRIRDLAIYLDELGGVYILDCLPEREIYDKILNKVEELHKTDSRDGEK